MDHAETLRFDLEDRLFDLGTKHHVSVRWEEGSGICRVGVMLDEYTWDLRENVLRTVLQFEADRADDVAVEVDIFPLEAATTAGFSHA